MNPYNDIQHKLHHFIRKYYTNELIKGSILFVAFGFLYFLFTLFIEYFLWLQPLARTILFWFFILGESLLFGRYILFPILKLIGFAKGLSLEEASTIIGRHFSEVDDKLLNMMQLRSSFPDSELVSASIAQKAANLSPIPFSRAIHLRANAKYLKYLLIPFVIFLLIFSTGRTALFNDSYVRIVNHQQEYSPPAPFYFQIDSLQLQILEGASFTLQVKTVGDVIPNEASIILDGDVFFLQNPSLGLFTYNFDNLRKPVHFYLEANGIRSKSYTIRIIPTPKIQHIAMDLHYPKYVGKNNETVNNSGSVIVPVGTHITWKVQTLQADSLFFSTDLKYIPFTPDGSNFILKQYINTNFHYTISASNHFLKDYEKLDFSVQVIDDAYPLIDIKTDIDSLSFGPAQFFGSLSDDYGLSRLELVYYDALHPSDIHTYNIPISKTKISSFYYLFPQHLTIEQGVDYQFYFKVYDNDAVRGPKFTKSNLYNYHKDTDIEHEEKLLLEAKKEEAAIAQQLKKFNQTHKNSKELLDNLRNKKDLEFNDAAELKQLLARQKQYQQIMQQHTDQLMHNLKQQPELSNRRLDEQRDDILQRIKESKDLVKENKLLEELQKLADKLNKEELLDKLDRLSSNSKQKEKSLEQLLELTKRFYVEQKADQIRQKLAELSTKEQNLSQSKDNTKEAQDNLNESFDKLSKEMDQLSKDNDALKEPMPFGIPKPDQESIKEDMKAASSELSQDKPSKAQAKQQSAANKLMKMSQSLQAQMQMAQGDMIQEDIALLRQIIENLLTFSYKQEDLMLDMAEQSNGSPSFIKNLKDQYLIKTYFEHIDDSLYVLSLRQPKLSSKINSYLSDAHYYLGSTLKHYADNQYNKANSDQHFVMKASNDLALLLSRLLDNMQSSMMGMGQGQGKGKGMGESTPSFSLPDIIKKQGDLGEEASKGKEPGGKESASKPGKEGQQGTSGKAGKNGQISLSEAAELYRIYQQQARLRNALETQLDNLNGIALKKQAGLILSEMENLEKRMLEQGLTPDIFQRMKQLQYKLLQLKDAKEEQEQDNKRQSKSALENSPKLTPKQLRFYKKYFNEKEILNRSNLPLKPVYQQKVKDYFNQLQ